MKLARRTFLSILAGGAAIGATGGCSRIIDELAQPDLPDVLNPPGGDTRHPIALLLNRAAFGPTPGQIEEVERDGRARWIDRQLNYKDIDDDALGWRLRRYDSIRMNTADLLSFRSDEDSSYVANELARSTLVRAVFSKRQLYEVMVNFWSDHFSLYHFKDKKVTVLKTFDDREVIRPHVLGKFSDLLRASAHSPAMLTYLDNIVNEKSHPNENYAREIMELHTLGVDGGYTEKDIQEVARCFTGWTVNGRGRFEFDDSMHDDGEKTVLGEKIPAGGGKRDADRVLEILIAHPSTARFISTKLVRRFIADDPPPEFVEACITTWQTSEGDMRAILRTLLNHPEFDQAPPKFKRPFEFLVSLLRATLANYDGDTDLVLRLERMGQRPFGWVTPDGYPDYAEIWKGGMLGRWNLAADAARSALPGASIDLWEIAEHVNVHENPSKMLRFFGRLFLARDLDDVEEAALRQFAFGDANRRLDFDRESDRELMIETLGLMLMSPAFQMR